MAAMFGEIDTNMYDDNHQMYIVGSDMSIMCTNMKKEGNSALKVIPWFCIAVP